MSDNPYSARLVDMVVSTSSLTDDFTDDEAIPLIDWASQQAERIGGLSESDEGYEEVADIFNKWIRTVFAILKRHHEADAAWLEDMIAHLNTYAPTLHTAIISPEQRDRLLTNIGTDTASYAAVLLPMIEPMAGEPASAKPTVIDAARSVLNQIGEAFGGDLSDVSRTTPEDRIPNPSIVPGPEYNPLSKYEPPISAKDEQVTDADSDDKPDESPIDIE